MAASEHGRSSDEIIQDLIKLRPDLMLAMESDRIWKHVLGQRLFLFKTKHPNLLNPTKRLMWSAELRRLTSWWAEVNTAKDHAGPTLTPHQQQQRQLATKLVAQCRESIGIIGDAATAIAVLPAASELITAHANAAEAKLADGRTLAEVVVEAGADIGFIAEVPALLMEDGSTLTVPQALLFASAKANPFDPGLAGLAAPAIAEMAIKVDADAVNARDGAQLGPLDHAIYARNWEVAGQIVTAGGTTVMVAVVAKEMGQQYALTGRLATAIHSCADATEFEQIMDVFGKLMIDDLMRASRTHTDKEDDGEHGQPIRPLTDRMTVVGTFLDLVLLGDADKFDMRAMPWFAAMHPDPRRGKVLERWITEIEEPLLAEIDRIAGDLVEAAKPQIQNLHAWAVRKLGAHYRQYYATDCFMQGDDDDDNEYRLGAAAKDARAPEGWSRAEKVLHNPAPTCLLDLLVDADASQAGYDTVLAEAIRIAGLDGSHYLRGPRKRPSRIASKLALRRAKASDDDTVPTWAELFSAVRDVVRGQLLAKTAREAINLRDAIETVIGTKSMEVVGYKDRTQRGGGTYGGWQDELLGSHVLALLFIISQIKP